MWKTEAQRGKLAPGSHRQKVVRSGFQTGQSTVLGDANVFPIHGVSVKLQKRQIVPRDLVKECITANQNKHHEEKK